MSFALLLIFLTPSVFGPREPTLSSFLYHKIYNLYPNVTYIYIYISLSLPFSPFLFTYLSTPPMVPSIITYIQFLLGVAIIAITIFDKLTISKKTTH